MLIWRQQSHLDDCARDGLHGCTELQARELMHQLVQGASHFWEVDQLPQLLRAQVVVALPSQVLLLNPVHNFLQQIRTGPQSLVLSPAPVTMMYRILKRVIALPSQVIPLNPVHNFLQQIQTGPQASMLFPAFMRMWQCLICVSQRNMLQRALDDLQHSVKHSRLDRQAQVKSCWGLAAAMTLLFFTGRNLASRFVLFWHGDMRARVPYPCIGLWRCAPNFKQSACHQPVLLLKICVPQVIDDRSPKVSTNDRLVRVLDLPLSYGDYQSETYLFAHTAKQPSTQMMLSKSICRARETLTFLLFHQILILFKEFSQGSS